MVEDSVVSEMVAKVDSPFDREENKDYKLHELVLVATRAYNNHILAYQFVPKDVAVEHIKKIIIELGGADNALSEVEPVATSSEEVASDSTAYIS